MTRVTVSRPAWSEPARAALAAVAFLTVVPVGRRVVLTAADVTRASAVFCVVGAGIGAVSGVIAWVVGQVAPSLLAGVLAVIGGAVVTGGLHLDGLADTADGYGGRSPADRLRIMRDHTIGAYGGTALVLTLLAKSVAFASFAGTPHAVAVAAAAGAVSRICGPVLTAMTNPVADSSAHTSVFHGRRSVRRAVPSVLLCAIIVIGCLGPLAWIPLTAAAVVLFLVARSATSRLGGVTGDTMGAASELIELAVLTAMVVALPN